MKYVNGELVEFYNNSTKPVKITKSWCDGDELTIIDNTLKTGNYVVKHIKKEEVAMLPSTCILSPLEVKIINHLMVCADITKQQAIKIVDNNYRKEVAPTPTDRSDFWWYMHNMVNHKNDIRLYMSNAWEQDYIITKRCDYVKLY